MAYSSSSSSSPSLIFPDLAQHWAKAFVESLHEYAIIQGFPDGTFRPDVSLTRAQYAALLAKMFAVSDVPIDAAMPFRDVSAQFWAVTAIQQASALGFIAGFPDGTFRPDDALTRAQAIVSLVNGLRLSGGKAEDLEGYRDRTTIPTYAKEEVATATRKRLVVNHPHLNQLNPTQPITRAEMATMLYQVRVMMGQSVAIASPFIVQPQAIPVDFSDVPRGGGTDDDLTNAPDPHWAADFIYGLAHQGFISGMTADEFAPERAVSRAEYAVLLTNIFQPLPLTDADALPSFIDVPQRFWAYSAIQQVVRAGLMAGLDDGSFQPHQDVKRWQMFQSLTTALKLPETDQLHPRQFYTDAASIPKDVQGAIAAATQHQLVVNHPNPKRIDANRGTSRAEVAAALYQSLTLSQRLPALSSPFIVPPLPPHPTPPLSPPPHPTPPHPRSPAPLLLPTVLLSPVTPIHPVQDLEGYLYGYTNQANSITQAVMAQLQQQGVNVVLHPHRTPNQVNDGQPSSVLAALAPADSDMLIRLYVSDQPVASDPFVSEKAGVVAKTEGTQTEGNQTVENPFSNGFTGIDEVAWHLTILFNRPSTMGLELAQMLNQFILERAGVEEGGIQSTTTLWPDQESALALKQKDVPQTEFKPIMPDAAVLIMLNPVAQLSSDYPPLPTKALVWAIATGTLNFLDQH